MNLLIKKYLVGDRDIRMFTIQKNKTGVNRNQFMSVIPVLLLSESERITFNFKSRNGIHLKIDARSDGHVVYEERNSEYSNKTTLFAVKSKLKNFGASYQSIMSFKHFNLLGNLISYYNESEQLDIFITDCDSRIIMLQPMPSYDKWTFEYIVSQLEEQEYYEVLDKGRFLEEIEVSLTLIDYD